MERKPCVVQRQIQLHIHFTLPHTPCSQTWGKDSFSLTAPRTWKQAIIRIPGSIWRSPGVTLKKKKERKNVDAIMCTLSGSLKCVWQCLLCCSLGRRKRTAWRILPSVAPWSLCHGTDETIAPLRLYGVTLFLAHDRMTMACHTVCVSNPWDLLYTPGQ